MKNNWSVRKEERTAAEFCFEEKLAQNGFKVLIVKKSDSKTDYLIEKDGVTCPFEMDCCCNNDVVGGLYYDIFCNYYKLKAAMSDI